MKQLIETNQPIKITKESDIKKATKYSYKTIIPKEVMDIFPQLKEDGKIVYNIKQVDMNKFEYEITFKAKGLQTSNENTQRQRPLMPRPQKRKKTNNAGNEKASNDDERYKINKIYPTRMDEYKLRLKQTNYTKFIEIIHADTNKRVNGYSKGATNRDKKETQEIMDKLSQCESLDDAKEIFDSIPK